MDFVSHVVPESGGKYKVSVGFGSLLSEEQLMQKKANMSNRIDFDIVAKVGFG